MLLPAAKDAGDRDGSRTRDSPIADALPLSHITGPDYLSDLYRFDSTKFPHNDIYFDRHFFYNNRMIFRPTLDSTRRRPSLLYERPCVVRHTVARRASYGRASGDRVPYALGLFLGPWGLRRSPQTQAIHPSYITHRFSEHVASFIIYST